MTKRAKREPEAISIAEMAGPSPRPAWLLELFGLAGTGPLGSGTLMHREVLFGPKDWNAAREAYCASHEGWATPESPLLRCTRTW